MFNRVVLIGRLTREPELIYTKEGTAVCKFTLAVNRKFNKDEADFIDIVAWRKLGENAANYLDKGRLVAVEGRLQIRPYETKDGQKRKATEIVADDIRFLEKGNGAKGQQQKPAQEEDPWADLGKEVRIEDDEFPC